MPTQEILHNRHGEMCTLLLHQPILVQHFSGGTHHAQFHPDVGDVLTLLGDRY